LIADALKFLFEAGRKSREVQFVELPGGRRLTLWGEDSEIAAENNEPINDQLTTLADLELWLQEYATDDAEPVVFVGELHVNALSHRQLPHEKNTAFVPLAKSLAWDALEEACKAPGVKQDQFVRLLRGPLAGAIDPKWLPVFRRMNFTRSNSTDRGVGLNGEKLGRSVEKLAQSIDGELPDQLQFTLPVFQLSELTRQVVRCAVEVDADSELIRLLPVGDDFQEAIDAARRQIAAWVREHKPVSVSVYMGNP